MIHLCKHSSMIVVAVISDNILVITNMYSFINGLFVYNVHRVLIPVLTFDDLVSFKMHVRSLLIENIG